jgi:hypothetical protein
MTRMLSARVAGGRNRTASGPILTVIYRRRLVAAVDRLARSVQVRGPGGPLVATAWTLPDDRMHPVPGGRRSIPAFGLTLKNS